MNSKIDTSFKYHTAAESMLPGYLERRFKEIKVRLEKERLEKLEADKSHGDKLLYMKNRR